MNQKIQKESKNLCPVFLSFQKLKLRLHIFLKHVYLFSSLNILI